MPSLTRVPAVARVWITLAHGAERILSLPLAFLEAGARAVIATIWEVGDRPAAGFMLRFHDAARGDRAPAEALRAAKISMIAPGDARLAHPAAWAPFVHVGASSRPLRFGSRGTALIAAVVVSLAPALAGPAGSADETALRVERLAALGRLWGTVELFHPWLATREIDWDRALIEAIPIAGAATTDEEYRVAVDRMLGVLEDPATKTVDEGGASPAAEVAPAAGGGDRPSLRWVEGGGRRIAVVSVREWGSLSASATAASGGLFTEAFAGCGEAGAIVLDLRREPIGPLPAYDEDLPAWRISRALQADVASLLTSDLRLGARRTRYHSGFAPRRGTTSGDYHSGFQTADHDVVRPKPGPAAGKPLVILTNRGSRGLVPILAGLQAQEIAVVVHEGSDASVFLEEGGTVVQVTGGLSARVRTSEVVAPGGGVGFRPDHVGPPGGAGVEGGGDPAFDRALEAARAFPAARAPHSATGTAAAARRAPVEGDVPYPDREHRLLALFRLWNTIHWFFPYKDLMDRPWDGALIELIPRFENVRDAAEYALAVHEAAARLQDTHAFVDAGDRLVGLFGSHAPPLVVRTLRAQVVVTVCGDEARAAGVVPGDVVVAVDGEEIEARRARIGPLLAASTPQASRWRTDRLLLRGGKDSVAVLGLRGAGAAPRTTRVARSLDPMSLHALESSGVTRPTFEILPEGPGYVDLTRLSLDQVDAALDAVRGAPALIFDMRGYPRGTAFAIGPRLASRRFTAAKFRRPFVADVDPQFRLTYEFGQTFEPAPGPRYEGRIVVLVDERAISQSEHSCLIFEAAAPGRVTFVGTPTNGANGDVTNVVLPGNIRVSFSGHDVRHADGRQLQRVGILPDVLAEPTPEGIRANRDEVLEAAVRHLTGEGPGGRD